MSVSAAIITDVKSDVISIPSSAIKTNSSGSYVEIPTDNNEAKQIIAGTTNNTGTTLNTPPRQWAVQVGITNDTSTEIINGLSEGDIIITRTITGTASKTTTTTINSLIPGAGGGTTSGNANFRAIQTGR